MARNKSKNIPKFNGVTLVADPQSFASAAFLISQTLARALVQAQVFTPAQMRFVLACAIVEAQESDPAIAGQVEEIIRALIKSDPINAGYIDPRIHH